jgi:hypothetical protein
MVVRTVVGAVVRLGMPARVRVSWPPLGFRLPPPSASADHGLDRSDRQVFEREVGVKDDYFAAAR